MGKDNEMKKYIGDMGFVKESDDLIQKRKVAIEKLGAKWIVHPINRIQRKEEKNGS